jgi:hypothetical protein
MLSQIITAAVDGFALADRASDRRRMIQAAEARAAAYAQAGQPRTIVIVRSAAEMRNGLRALPDASAIVFVDCALECCDDEEDLLRCWAEVCRIAGATEESADDVYVLHVQRWASARLNLDPRVRWVILAAPPRRDGTGRLEYRAFGRRRTILAETALLRQSRHERGLAAKDEEG